MTKILGSLIVVVVVAFACSVVGAAAPSVEDRVIPIVAKQLGVSKDQVSAEKSFTKDLKADTYKLLKLFSALQDEFHIAIPDNDAKKLQTVGQTIEYIQKKTKSRK